MYFRYSYVGTIISTRYCTPHSNILIVDNLYILLKRTSEVYYPLKKKLTKRILNTCML